MEKTHLTYLAIILLLIIVGIAYLIQISNETIPKKLYESEKKSMQDSIEASRQREADLKLKDSRQLLMIDSLEKKQAEYAALTEAAKDSIDHILSLDSTQALKENRKALAQLGIRISSGPFLSNYEMGWNAKFLQENYGMKLQLRVCDETKDSLKANIKTQKELIAEKEKQVTYTDSLKTIADENAGYWEKKYEATQSFWDDRFIIYGGVGINYSGTNLAPGIQAGVGFRIITIKFGGEE